MPPIDNILSRYNQPKDYSQLVDTIGEKYPSVSSDVVKALIQRESSGRPYASVDTQTRHGEARGLGQFIDDTAKEFIPEWKGPEDSYIPEKNIEGIFRYLDHLQDRTGSTERALQLYLGGGESDRFGTRPQDYAREILSKAGQSNKSETPEIDNILSRYSGGEPYSGVKTPEIEGVPIKSPEAQTIIEPEVPEIDNILGRYSQQEEKVPVVPYDPDKYYTKEKPSDVFQKPDYQKEIMESGAQVPYKPEPPTPETSALTSVKAALASIQRVPIGFFDWLKSDLRKAKKQWESKENREVPTTFLDAYSSFQQRNPQESYKAKEAFVEKADIPEEEKQKRIQDLDNAIKFTAKVIDDLEQQVPEGVKREIQKAQSGELNPLKNPTEALNTWATSIADQTGLWMSNIAGPGAGVATAVSSVRKEFVDNAKQQGFTEDEIDKFADTAAFQAGALEYAGEIAMGMAKIPGLNKLSEPLKNFIGQKVIGRVAKVLGSAAAEGLTEYSQQAVFNYYMGKMARDKGWSEEEIKEKFKNDPILKSRDFIIGAGIGGGMTAVREVADYATTPKEQPVQQQEEQPEVFEYTPEEIQARQTAQQQPEKVEPKPTIPMEVEGRPIRQEGEQAIIEPEKQGETETGAKQKQEIKPEETEDALPKITDEDIEQYKSELEREELEEPIITPEEQQEIATGKQQEKMVQEKPDVLKVERRKNIEKRKKIEEMTVEEAKEALSKDELTGLGSRRAWEDVEKKPVQGFVDVDGLKWANDNLGYESGDLLLQATADALQKSGIEAYRVGGDEIKFQGDDKKTIDKAVENAYNTLQEKTIEVELPNGEIIEWKGMGFSHGTAENTDFEAASKESERLLKEAKKTREQQGYRSPRGEEPPGVSRKTPEGIKDNKRKVAEPSKAPIEKAPKKPIKAVKPKEITKEPTTFKESIREVEKQVPKNLWNTVEISIKKTPEGSQGQIYKQGNKLKIELDPDMPAKRIVPVVFHEVMGHAGASNVLKSNKKVYNRLKAMYNAPSSKLSKTSIQKAYKQEIENAKKRGRDPEDVLFSEWLASNVEKHLSDPKRRGVPYRVYRAVREFLISLGVTEDTVEDAIDSVVKEIRRTNKFEPTVDTETRFAKEIEPETDMFGVVPDGKLDKMARVLQNKYNRLEKIEEFYNDDRVSKDLELMKGLAKYKIDTAWENHVEPLIKYVKDNNLDFAKLEDYAYALHAPERNKHIEEIRPEFKEKGIPGSGMSDKTSKKIISEIESSDKASEYKKAVKELQDINKRARRTLLDAGLINKETLDAWENYKNYVPLRGINEENTYGETGGGIDVKGQESKRALGRKSKARNILAHSILQLNRAIVRAEKNKVLNQLYDVVKSNPNENLWEIDPVETETYFNESKGEVDQREKSVRVVKDPETGQLIPPITVKRKGKEYNIFLKDAKLAKGFKEFGPKDTNTLLDATAGFNRYLSLMSTSLTPEFTVTNLLRDSITAGINIAADVDKKAASQTISGIPSAIKTIAAIKQPKTYGKFLKANPEMKKWYNEFRASGAEIGFLGLINEESIQNDIIESLALSGVDILPLIEEQEKGRSGIAKKFKKAVRAAKGLDGKSKKRKAVYKSIKAMENFVMGSNEAFENATRLSTYITMRKNGMSKADAARYAKNVTVNFEKEGTWGRYFKSLWVFSNASIQGTARLSQVLKTPTGRKMAIGMIVGSASAAYLARLAMGRGEDDEWKYDKIPDWVKQNNIIFPNPFKDDSFVTFPMPYGYNVFHAIGQSFEKVLFSENEDKVSDGTTMIMDSFMNSFNPLGGEISIGFSPEDIQTTVAGVTPTIGKPIIELAINRNFYGAPIYVDQKQKFGVPKSPAHTSFKNTRQITKEFTQFFNDATGGNVYEPGFISVSPDIIDYLYDYATGGAGRFIGQMVNLGVSAAKREKVPVRQIPFVRRFLGEVPDYYDVGKYYDAVDKIETKGAEYKRLREVDKEKAKEYKEKNSGYLWYLESIGNRKRINVIVGQIRKLKKIRDDAAKRGKDETVEKLDKEIKRRIDDFNKQFKQKTSN